MNPSPAQLLGGDCKSVALSRSLEYFYDWWRRPSMLSSTASESSIRYGPLPHFLSGEYQGRREPTSEVMENYHGFYFNI
jgi:hypothetical protein